MVKMIKSPTILDTIDIVITIAYSVCARLDIHRQFVIKTVNLQ